MPQQVKPRSSQSTEALRCNGMRWYQCNRMQGDAMAMESMRSNSDSAAIHMTRLDEDCISRSRFMPNKAIQEIVIMIARNPLCCTHCVGQRHHIQLQFSQMPCKHHCYWLHPYRTHPCKYLQSWSPSYPGHFQVEQVRHMGQGYQLDQSQRGKVRCLGQRQDNKV